MKQKGDRVGAILSSSFDEKEVKFLGYGVYLGDEVPVKGVTLWGVDLHAEKHMNPAILLDSGEKVYGCECWWGLEATTRGKLAGWEKDGWTVVDAPIDWR